MLQLSLSVIALGAEYWDDYGGFFSKGFHAVEVGAEGIFGETFVEETVFRNEEGIEFEIGVLYVWLFVH